MADTMRLGSENRRKLYDNLIGDGFDLGSFEDFEKNMKNKDVRRSIYDSAIEAGWELPEYGDFDKDMNSYYTGTKGNLKEVDRATYEGFMQRHPGKQSQKPVSIPKSQPQQRDSVNAENGYVFTEAGLDSLQQGFPARYVGAPANESPANESISTPWGTEGSATGKSRHYTSTAPGQVRSTELPSGSSYQTPYRPNLTAAQRDEIERENNFAIEQNKKLIQAFNNEEERRNKPLVDTGNKTVNQSVIKTQGQWDDELQRGISELGNIISPMVSNAMKKADDTWWKIMEQNAQRPRFHGMEITDLKQANEATDPDKILQGLQKSLKAAYDTPEMKEEIEKRANALGIPKDDYLSAVVAPALQQRLSSEFASSQIASRLPKNATEYIMQGLSNSVIGMLGTTATQTQSQRRYSTEAQAMTEEGLNPYYNPGTGARLAQMGVTFAADAPFFGLYGRIGGNVVKRVAEQQIKNLMAKGLSEGAARSLVGTALQNSAGARMRQYIMQHVGSSAITMGGFNLTSEGARQAHEGEFDPMKLAGSTGEGLATGAAFGLTGGAAQALTQPLSGISKIGAKIAGFGVEAETLYATEELAKMMHGEEGFTNPFEGSVESLMKLGVMKASSGHPLTKAIETGIGIKQDGFRKTLAKSLSGQAIGIKFTPEEEAYVRNSVEGKNLLESLSQMHPEVAVSEVNGKKKLTPEGEKMRQQLSESYNRFMSDTEIPANVKQKVALTLGGLYRPGLETGSDIIHGDDGSVVLKTRDKDGNCIQELHFDSFSDAELWRDEHEADFRLNDAVNMFNGSTVEARAKMLGELMQEYGVDAEQARSMIDAALRGSMGKSFDNEQFLSIYDTIRRNAYPDDELNTQRRYWEGKQLTNEEKHFAVTDLQVAEEQLSLFGQDFADEVMAAKDYPDEKMAELAQRKDITGEQLKAALRYYNQSAKVDGMMDETLKTVDQQVDAANSFIQRNTHPDTGMLIAGTARGKNVYVTAGHFTLSPDGRLMPTDISGAVIVRDANTGEISVVSPNEVTATAVNDPKLLMAANDSMEGLRGQLMKEAENTIELRPDTPTEAANGDIYMGADGNMYMAVQTKDEAGNSVWGKFAVDETGEPVGNPMPFDIDEYRKAKSDEKDQADKPEAEISIVDGVTESEEETPAPQPEETPETPVVEEQPVQRIPVDEKGHRLFEKAKPEDTLAELTEKYGAEKAQQMIAKIAESTARAFEELSNKDTSKITDMDELAAHEDALTEAEQKMKYWQDLLPKEEPKNDEQITEEPDIEPEPAAEPEQTPATPEAPVTPAQEPETPVVQPEEPVTPPAEPQAPPMEPEKPAEPTAEQKVAQGTVKNNIGKRFGFRNQDGTRSEIVLDVFKGDDKVTVTRQDFDMDGKPEGKPYSTDFNLVDVGNSIINGVLKPALSPGEKLRKVFKVTVGDVPLIDVLTEDEQQQLLDLHAKKDNEAIGNLTHDLIQSHREDIILKGREIRNSKVASILNSNASREEKLRRIRKLYQSFDEAPVYLEDESMKPVNLEEYVADLHSRVPKSGEGTIAYFSYEKDGTPITGLQDESGYGTKSGGDADAFKPWLAPKGKGMSLMKYAEQIHSQLPEPIQEQFDVNAVRNAILNVFGGAERPSDIPTMIIKRGIIQAEQAARRMEEMMIDDAPSFQKMTVNNNSFTNRLERAKEQTNTEPTDAQKEKGNYKKGHVSFGGYDFVVENPEGSMRRGEADGKKWEQKMNNTYGYILGKFGKDGDHLDMFINDKADLDNWNGNVYVIDQVNPKTGEFDEHKVMYGFDSEAEARDAYLSNYQEDWKGLGKITGVDKDTFDEWLDSSDKKIKEFADHSIIKEHMVERVSKAFDSALQKLDEREISVDDPELLKEYGLKNVVLSRYGDHLTLTHFIAEEQGKGNGTRFMNDFARLADHKGWTLAVTPDTSFGGTSVKRLKDFYKRFGFKDNKGRNADFETRESMIRRPKDYQPNSPEKQEKTMRDAVVEHLRQAGIEVSDDWKEGQRILDEYNGRKTVGEEVESDVKTQKVTDQEEVDQLNNGKTVKRYRAMQLIDGKLYPPMSAKVDGEMREPTEIGVWEKAEERPDLVKNGKFVLNKGQKGQSNVPAAYNPYFHTSTSGLNDQFTSAYKRPELVVVEVEIPESELTSGYQAEGAKDAVGDVSWHSGVVNGQLPADRQRQVTLSRYSKVNRIVPDSEVADMIAKQLEGTNVEVPYNVVTPALRAELEKRGVKIGSKPAGSVTEDINGNPIRQQKADVVDMYAKTADISKPIEETVAKDPTAYEAMAIKERVEDMSPAELIENYRRINSQMLEEDGMTVDEHEEKVKREYIEKNGLNGLGKAMADHLHYLSDKYGFGKLSLRWDLLDRINELGLEEYANSDKPYNPNKLPEVPENSKATVVDMHGRPMFFKTPDGHAYGYTYRGKIYIDPRIATSETPIHEYGHLWAEMKRQNSPEEWNHIKDVMLNDKLVQPIIDRVKRDYPELAKEGKEDAFVEEVITQFSGKRGNERLREIANEIAEERGGIFGKAEAVTAMQRLKNILNRFWEGVANMMGWKYKNANQIADKMMLDFLEGMNPSEEINGMNHKRQQLDIISRTNPMHDDYHTGIRSIDDIKTFEEAYNEGKKTSEEGGCEELASYPDITNELVEDARKTGKITVYSSYPIKDGVFVTPSMMQAKDYAGEGRVYSKRVPLDDVAWINLDEGQYAKVAKVKPQKENAVARDKEYAEAVAAGDMEKVDAMLREEARRKGYTEDSSYQGSLAFNGAAPSKNGYFETREERKQAMEDGTFEDTFSLGDYAEAGIDANDLEWQLANPMNASAGNKATLASIRNINNALKSKNGKIKMYRAVDAAIKENSFRNGDWVTPSREYAEQHIGLQDWKKGRIIEQEVSIDDIWWNGDDINEWGYDDGKGYAYKNTKNNRKLMEPTYDNDGNLIPLSQRFNDRKDDIMFQMMGEKGATEADKLENNAKRMESLKLAEEAEEGGYDAKAIKFATGWERGADGKWRYEIPDADVDIVNAYKQVRLDHDKEVAILSKEEDGLLEQYQHLTNIIPGRIDSRYSEEQKAKYREMRKQREKLWKQYLKAGEKVKEYDEQGVSMSLGELMGEDNEVFKYYPELKDVKVSFTSMQGGTAGSFGEDGIKIGYNELKRFDNDELNNENVYATLLHEVQHAIQDIEGFASGGNLYTSTTEEGISAIVEKKQRKAADIKQRLDANRKILSSPEELKFAAVLEGKSEKEVKEQLIETIDQQAAEYDTLNNQIEYIKNTKAPAKSDAVDLYRRLSGEVESRNVESRMKLTDQERMVTLASETEDVPRDEQVIIMSNGKAMNINDIKPVGTGDFGDIYDQFKGMPKEAVDFLVKKKGGDLLGVFHRDEVGDIDLVWGESYNRYKGKGLSHIIKKHIDTLHDFKDVDELTSVLEDVINNGEMGDDYAIEKDGYRVVIAKEKDGKRWILTAFDNSKTKKEKASRTSLNTPSVDKGEGAVSPDASLSESKDSKNINSLQENSEKFSSEAPKFQKAPVFISNALKAAEGIKQEKATPEQWLAMLQKNGGLKAGEDKWLGLSDWLKEQKGSVTKQDVLNYIRKNQIQVEEVPYQEYVDVDDNPKMQEFRKEFDELVSMYENRKATVEKEMETFDPEMSEKYGYGWANKLEGKDLERYNDIYDRYEKLTTNATRELAFEDMVDRYGDDFSMAFEVNYGNGKLEPQMDMYGDDISDTAKNFLELTVQPINSTRLSYTTNGLENKKEIALTVPTIEPYNESDSVHFGDAGGGRAVAWVRFGDTYVPNMGGDPNSLADGVSHVLVIDEIQSKRHQDARNQGYSNTEEIKRLERKLDELIKKQKEVTEKEKVIYDEIAATDEVKAMLDKNGVLKPEYQEEYNKIVRDNEELQRLSREWAVYGQSIRATRDDITYEKNNGVPDAPFDKNWHELAMKRMLRYAAENGYDKIAWTTGKQQADRYSLSKAFNSVEREDNPSIKGKRFVFSGGNVEEFVVDDEGKVVDSTINDAKGKNLSDLVGKDMAVKLMGLENGDMIEGEDLRIGGEGMKGFYDEILPRFMNKYSKKWGVKVGELQLPDINQTMWSVDVTPEMKESVMQGQPMFQRVSPEAEMTPEEKQYWKQWDAAMKKWKERNALPVDAEGPGEKPVYQQGELALDYAKRMAAWHRKRNLWQTAPKLEDYRQAREDKSNSEEARTAEMKYPDSEANKRWRVAADLARIRHAMARQKAYDKSTVKAVTDFAQDFMKMGFGDNLSRGEMERMLSSVKNATGAKDIKKYVDNIMNILVDNHLKNLENRVWELASVKELKQTAQGVERQGKLELKGQKMIQSFREARESRMTVEEIKERMAEVMENIVKHPDSDDMWEQEYEGLVIALQYAENIDGSRQEFKALDDEYKDAVKSYKESGRSYQAQQQLLESLDKAMLENKIERIGSFGDIIGRLEGNIAVSIEGAKEFLEREKQRVKHIQEMANFDLAGKDMGAQRKDTKGKPANFFLQPLGTFEQMLKQFGARNANGEGYLYNYFMRNWMDATDKAYLGEKQAKDELDAKAREVFGEKNTRRWLRLLGDKMSRDLFGWKVERWSDLYKIVMGLPTMDVEVADQGDKKTFTLTQGNLLYIYMANKMNDGAMKLRKMGIDEETVERIKDFLDPRLVQLGDWLQDEYLPGKRVAYNKVHERMFGAPMAAIDHYFPIKILSDARVQEQDVNVPDSETLPSTITGNIIKRRKNALPLDILNTDAVSLAIEHIEDMEHWAAQAEWNRDVNALLSYTTFRNKVKNMKTIYGSGDALWNTFKDAAKMAAGTYNSSAKSGHIDKTISNIAKGVTAAKIAFRVYTAFKQTLSAPAFLHDVDLGKFAKYSVNPYGSWKWAMENMPVFRKRWESRQVGDTRLMDDPTDWKMWKNDIVQLASRWGMSPNAIVDGVTCAVGARAIYESRLEKYQKMGVDEETAKKRALQDAEIGYNLTQQSSEGAFVSAIQKDRTVAANMLSVFRNSSMAYTRQWVDASRNLKHRMQKGYKEDSIGFMQKQFEEQFGMDEEQARQLAEAEYARAGRHDVARLLNMMFGVTIAWNLGASLPYLLIGDDDDTKEEMLKDALLKGLIAGPSEGFASGNLISDFVGRTLASEETRKTLSDEGVGAAVDAALKQGGDFEINPLPLMSDIQGMIGKLGYDKYAALQDIFNICMQSAVGVNPQTFTDMYNAIMDYAAPGWDGTKYTWNPENMLRAKELALFMMRMINAPTSSWRNKYIDELGMNAEDAKKLSYEEMARRYAHYKHWKDSPFMGWLRGEEGRQEKMEKIRGQFDKSVQERIERLTDEELRHNVARSGSLDERRMIARTIAKRLGITQSVDGKKAKEEWQQNYQRLMTYEDIREDELLYQKKHEASERGDKKTIKAIDKALDKIKERGKKKLGFGEDHEKMEMIRQWRREALEKALKAEGE